MGRYRNNPSSGNNNGLLMRLLGYALTIFIIPFVILLMWLRERFKLIQRRYIIYSIIKLISINQMMLTFQTRIKCSGISIQIF